LGYSVFYSGFVSFQSKFRLYGPDRRACARISADAAVKTAIRKKGAKSGENGMYTPILSFAKEACQATRKRFVIRL
jgi:hypothetical protein